MNLHLGPAPLSESVLVETKVEGIQTDPSTGTSFGEDSIRFLPANGRTVDALVRTAPGVVPGAGGLGDEIDVNGLRANANYYTMDGVSLGTGSAVAAARGRIDRRRIVGSGGW